MSQKKKLIVFLLIVPGILAEILSSNTPIMKLILNPFDFIGLMVAYGLPMLLIWDYKVKKSLSFFGLFLVGLAYGIFNEGMVAKTILATSPVPIGGFQGFGTFFGLNLPWALMILPWHAFLSVMFPIAFAERLFPDKKNTLLLSKKMSISIIILCFVALVFIGKDWQGTTPGVLLIAYYVGASALLFLACFFRSSETVKVSIKKRYPYLAGFLTIVLYLFYFIFPGKIPSVLYMSIGLIMLIIILRYFFSLDTYEKTRFAVGNYLSFGGFATLGSIGVGRVDLLIMYILLLSALHIFILRKPPITS